MIYILSKEPIHNIIQITNFHWPLFVFPIPALSLTRNINQCLHLYALPYRNISIRQYWYLIFKQNIIKF